MTKSTGGARSVRDLFDAKRPSGDLVCRYKDWELKLGDGSILNGCVSNYIVVRRLGAAYFEWYLDIDDPNRTAAIICALLGKFLLNPQFLLPESIRNNLIKLRRNEQDVHIPYNQLPIMASVTIFASARLELREKEKLVAVWREKGLDLIIKDQNYVDAHERELRPYAFISHDSGDKAKIARPLAERLRADVGTIWYDEYSLQVGDSLRESIEDGLKRSDCCVILLSKKFLQNTGWGKREFDSIYTREIVEKKKVMLPVWINVSRNELYEYSPILADRVAARWTDGIDKVAASLAMAIRSSNCPSY